MKLNLLLKRAAFLLLTLVLSASMTAQVQGISYTIAPMGSYTWFNNKAGLDEAFQFGGYLGLGFGEFVELRALYMQTINQKIDLAGFEIDETLLDDDDVELSRYGGELKLNLSRGHLLPFLTVGAGVQNIGRSGLEDADNIYASAGLGLTLSAADRFAFTVEGKNIAYNYNAIRNLLSAAEREAQNIDLDDFELERFGNWEFSAALQFYLGGRRPGELSDIDQAYLNAFGNGFKGLSLPIEVNLARVNFDNSLPYRDTWMGGGNIGVDIGPWIGLRAFYLRAMDDDKVQLDFEKLSMYGGDVRLNLNRASQGFTPFLTFGGGYLSVGDEYVPQEDKIADSQGFATGGGGLILSLGDNLRLNGTAKALLMTETETEDIEDLTSTDQLTTSWMYTMGLTLAFGNKADPEEKVQAKIDERLDAQEEQYQTQIEQQRQENQRKSQELKQRYEKRVVELERQLNEAYDSLDVDRAAEILAEKEKADSIVIEIERREAMVRRQELDRDRMDRESLDRYYPHQTNPYPPTGIVVLTPDQLNLLLNRADNNRQPAANVSRQMEAERYRQLERRLQRMEEMLRYSNERSANPAEDRDARDQEVERYLDDLDRQLQEMNEATPDTSNNQEAIRERLEEMQQEIRRLRQDRRDEADRSGQYQRSNREEDLRRTNRELAAQMADLKKEIRKLQDAQRDYAENVQNDQDQRTREEPARREESPEKIDIDVNDENDPRYERSAQRRRVQTIDEIDIQRGGPFLGEDGDTSGVSKLANAIRYTGMSGFGGFNIGKDNNNTFNLGLRWHYDLGETRNFQIMPEAFFGFGTPSNFGLFVNGLAILRNEDLGFFQPYAGAGFGFMHVAENDAEEDENYDLRPALNLLIGTYVNVLGGRVYIDLTGRNLFRNNQLVAGYRFAF